MCLYIIFYLLTIIVTTVSMQKQSQICPTCISYMEFTKDNTWLRCPTCGFMKKVVKTIIKPVGVNK